MHESNLEFWKHSHSFGQHRKRPGETRTLIVIALTSIMMLVEIGAGILFGSMALLADGLHMASHTAALTINAFAYIYARRHAHNEGFSFGTGKVNTLGGFTGAVLLAGFALFMAWEGIARLFSPVDISFDQAIIVACLGLVVNGASVFILGQKHAPSVNDDDDDHSQHHHDHNLLAAYLHVLADALISFLAIFALLSAKFFGFVWADPIVGILGAILVARWSISLIHATSKILLDRRAPEKIGETVRVAIESSDDNRIVDLHIWSVGPNLYSAIITLITHSPKDPNHYKALIPKDLNIAHMTVEVHACDPVSS